MTELIDKQKAQTEIALIAKHLARSDAQKAIIGRILFMIDNLPTIEAEPVRQARWIPTEYDGYADGYPVYDAFECSECGHEHSGEEDTLTAFCPDCGARMDGGTVNDRP